jgi:hypothetical protein
MSRIEQLESQFRALHKSTYQEFNEKNRFEKEQHDFRVSQNQGDEEKYKRIVQELSQVSADDESRALKARRAAEDEQVAKFRSEMNARPSNEIQSRQRRAVLQGFAARNHQTIPVYASRIMTTERSVVEHIQGEHGNPWVLPWNPDKVQVDYELDDDTYGTCGLAQAANYPTVVDFWFPFLADTTGVWNLMGLVDSFGYYVINAHNSFALCREASVTYTASVSVYQYFWTNETKFQVVHERTTTGLKYELITEYGDYIVQAALRADPNYYVFVKVSMTLNASVYGPAHAELNFKDGANCITPIIVIAYPNT